jgi:hypothetical protein
LKFANSSCNFFVWKFGEANLLKECEVDDRSKPSWSIQWWVGLVQLQPFIKVLIVKLAKMRKEKNESCFLLHTFTKELLFLLKPFQKMEPNLQNNYDLWKDIYI